MAVGVGCRCITNAVPTAVPASVSHDQAPACGGLVQPSPMQSTSKNRVHAVQTGTVSLHPRQVHGRGYGLRRRVAPLAQRGWTAALPILAWAIEHPEGLIVSDTGETARTSQPGYLPRLRGA